MATSKFNRVALKSVVVVREGKRVSPPIGKSFPFTEEEVEALEAANPTAIRKAVNEDQEADMAEVVGLANSNTRVKPKTAAQDDDADAAAEKAAADKKTAADKKAATDKAAAKTDDDL